MHKYLLGLPFKKDIGMDYQIPLLYQYRAFHDEQDTNRMRLEQLLIKNELFFSSPADFNDPFDCWISPIPTNDLIFNLCKENTDSATIYLLQLMLENDPSFFHQELRNKVKNRFYVACLSEIKNNPLMLAHYSNNHTGYFIEYNFLTEKNTFEEWGKSISKFLQVNYFPFKEKYKIYYPVINDLQDSPDAFEYMFSTKPEDWNYEKEWRIIIDSENIPKPHNEKGISLKFPPIFIKGIYLAAKVSKENFILMKKLSKSANVPLYGTQFQEGTFELLNMEITK
jgi:hypothetical protein